MCKTLWNCPTLIQTNDTKLLKVKEAVQSNESQYLPGAGSEEVVNVCGPSLKCREVVQD